MAIVAQIFLITTALLANHLALSQREALCQNLVVFVLSILHSHGAYSCVQSNFIMKLLSNLEATGKSKHKIPKGREVGVISQQVGLA